MQAVFNWNIRRDKVLMLFDCADGYLGAGVHDDGDANLCKSVAGERGPAPPSLDIDHATRLGVSQPPP